MPPSDLAPTRRASPDRPPSRPDLARFPVLSAMLALALTLALTSGGYGYHRDELYFRMLDPAWGYVDQPPLTPLMVQALSAIVDQPWAIRVPAILAAAGSVPVMALITRELGGGRNAQSLAAWGYASASTPLLMGHVMLTASLDLLVWPAIGLLMIRAFLRNQDRWWYATGVVVGLSMYNKLLVAGLLVSFAVGLLITGPRTALWSRGALAAAGLALVVGAPNLLYQATHGWPQVTMGAALSGNNAGEVRATMWLFLVVLLGPFQVPVWIAGLVSLWCRPTWRPVRFLAAAFPVLLLLAFAVGGQIYYPSGLLAVLYAAGCVPAAAFLAGRTVWRRTMVAGLALNAVIAGVIALPLLPEPVLGVSPVPGINQLAADQIGWPAYVRQIAEVHRTQAPGTVIITSNYGEAGAVARYGPDLGLPHPYSGHNELYFAAQPPEGSTTAIIVGGQADSVRRLFEACRVAATLDNGVGVDNEEQGRPIMVCTEPLRPWSETWPSFQHFD
ncbi:ArnT family glycosyltransferase [Arthrobacter agilis]|uniref:ArnT family glycosyltransferase n=1 Tax=Arthrobacter agilis TaxID=37921 RepID=UPI00277D6962|nr:glycosyltransferase family 39 protein [Arthrobacter agilis]MDQ0737006.1 hypothetical protein [Arthrobacter agilis]